MTTVEMKPPFYCVRLSGGLRILFDEKNVHWVGFPDNRNCAVFSAIENPDMRELLAPYKELKTLAFSYHEHEAELGLPVSQRFHIHAYTSSGKNLEVHQKHYWQGIAETHRDENSIENATRADRIQTQIMKATTRFEKLTEAYSLALAYSLADADTNLKYSQNLYSDNIGSEFLAVLECLYALRDALNEYYFHLKHQNEGSFTTRKLRKLVAADTQSQTAKLIHATMFDAEGGDRTVYRMSLFRAVSQHCLGHVNPVVGDFMKKNLGQGNLGKLCWVTFPLYDDLEAMHKIERGDRNLLSDEARLQEWKRFCELTTHQDAMDFSHACFVKLLQIGEAIAAENSLKPTIPVFTMADVKGDIEFEDEDGIKHKLVKANNIQRGRS